MAIYHLNGQILSKVSKKTGKPKSPLACAAYRSGEKLEDEQIDQTFFYKREIEPDTFILSPEHAPEWTEDRQTLWNEVNKIEKNYNAQFAREFNIALPIELSNSEQNNLTKDFCQEAFVDEGMVADIAIHRDDLSNPHFHVMLTVRPFLEDGTWGNKSKREYTLDNNGNHILDHNGKKKFRKVNLTNWNDRETFNSWRELWADKANEYLVKNDFTERISHLSNKDLGVEKLPTIHEGFVARKMQKSGIESERITHNENIKKYNRKIESINEYKEEKRNIQLENKLTRKFSPQEKKSLANIAKELRFFVNKDTLEERKSQLNKWKKSVQFKPESESKLGALSRIEKEEQAIKQAEIILNEEANRFIKVYYPTYDVDSLTHDEKLIIVDETLRQNDILTDDQIDNLHMSLEANNLRKELSGIFKNRWVFVANVEEHLTLAKEQLNTIRNKLGLPKQANEEMIREAIKERPWQAEPFKNAAENVVKLTDIQSLMKDFYNSELKAIFPDKNFEYLGLDSKEFLLAMHEYLGEKYTDEFTLVARYSTEQQKEIIDALGMNYRERKDILNNNYPEFQWSNPIHILLLKEESTINEELPLDYLIKLAKIDPERIGQFNINQAVPLKEINDHLNVKALDKTTEAATASGTVQGLRSIADGILSDRRSEGLAKQQFEKDLNKKKKFKKQNNRGQTL